MLSQLIDAAVKNLIEFYKISSLVDHSGEKGGFREYFVSQMVRPFIPSHFGISSGIVMDYQGKQSSQSDVIIYDKRLMPPILQAEGKGIFPIECVLMVIEVKSKLCSTHFGDIGIAASRLAPEQLSDGTKNPNGLHIATPARTKDQITSYPLYGVFAYESDATDKDEFDRLREKSPLHYKYVRSICVLNKGNWVQRDAHTIVKNLTADPFINGKDFLIINFNKLEQVALERGLFRLQDWIKLSPAF